MADYPRYSMNVSDGTEELTLILTFGGDSVLDKDDLADFVRDSIAGRSGWTVYGADKTYLTGESF